MTEYRILRRTEHGNTGPYWEEFATAQGASAKAAIRKLAEAQATGEENTYIAIPTRSWQPVKVQVETALKFS